MSGDSAAARRQEVGRRRHGAKPWFLRAVGAAATLVLLGDVLALRGPLVPDRPSRHWLSAPSPFRRGPNVSDETVQRPTAQVPPTAPRFVRVLGLGDSVPAGTACGCPSFISRLASELSRPGGRVVAATDDAQDGATSSALLNFVEQRQLTANPDEVTVVTIGANDFDARQVNDSTCGVTSVLRCYAAELSSLEDAVIQLVTRLRRVHTAGPVLITGYWNVFLDGAVGRSRGATAVAVSDALTKAVNARLEAACRATGATYVDLYTPFHLVGDDTDLLAPDGDHPSDKGHQLIAGVLMRALQE